uniref:Uncharacterized protein n=1 Tax=Anguilla anguilla TaxID=7936 RepID=A0A0E9UTJ8_ANGAN
MNMMLKCKLLALMKQSCNKVICLFIFWRTTQRAGA